MRALFTYGTLMFPEVIEIVAGRVPPSESARLVGFRRRVLRGVVYPGLTPRAGEVTRGVLFRGLDEAELSRVDAFEGELYERVPCRVHVSEHSAPASTYVIKAAHRDRLSPSAWDPEAFRRDELRRYLAGCRRFAGALASGRAVLDTGRIGSRDPDR